MGALDQLFSRSRREIEAHATELVDNETGRHFITLAAEFLAALRLWAQRQYRSDQAVRELLEAVDPVTTEGDSGRAAGSERRRRNRRRPSHQGDDGAAFGTPAGDRLVRRARTVTSSRR